MSYNVYLEIDTGAPEDEWPDIFWRNYTANCSRMWRHALGGEIGLADFHRKPAAERLRADLAAARNEYDRTLNLLMTVDARLDETKARAEQAEERADSLEQALARVVKLALSMRDWCSPHGVAPQYANRIAEAILNLDTIDTKPGAALAALTDPGWFTNLPASSAGDTHA